MRSLKGIALTSSASDKTNWTLRAEGLDFCPCLLRLLKSDASDFPPSRSGPGPHVDHSGTRRSSCCCETTNSRNRCKMVFAQEISFNFNFESCISSRPPFERAFILNLNARTIDTVSPKLVCSFCLAQPLPPLELELAQREKGSRLMDSTVSLTICPLDRIFIFEIYAPRLTRDL